MRRSKPAKGASGIPRPAPGRRRRRETEKENIWIFSTCAETARGYNGRKKERCISVKFQSVKENCIYLDASRSPLYGDAHYPRIKLLRDGRYMLIFQTEQLGGTIYCAFSPDLEQWSDPRPIVSAYKVRMSDGSVDVRKFMTADAIVLDNGDILVVCSYRVSDHYRTAIADNGLVAIRSCDGGETWSVPEIIYVGTNWEPHVLRLRSGEIHVYFTQIAPKIYLHGFKTLRRSSGIGLIRSYDDGKTWTPFVTEPPYAAQRAAQQYVTDVEGVRHYTDQMPVGAELKDGSIVLALESRAEDLSFHLSLAFTHDNWARDLAMDEDGPEDRMNFIRQAAGPYIVALDSGLTAMSFNRLGQFFVCAGDETGHCFDEPVRFFEEFTGCFWGSLLALPGNRVVACLPEVTKDHTNRIGIQVLKLHND